MARVLNYVNRWMKVDRGKRAKRIVKKYSTQLTKAAMRRVSEGATLASSLYNENYIHDRYFLEMVKTVNKAEPELDMVYASTMISAIRRIIYADPEAFQPIINILKRHDSVSGIARKMEKEYYDDEDVLLKLAVFGLAGLCVLAVFLVLFVLFIWYYYFSPSSECLKITADVRESIFIALNTSSSVDTDIDFETLSSQCKEVFEHYSLPYEQYKTQCNQTEEELGGVMVVAACVGKLVVSEMESELKGVCVESIAPVLGCLGIQLNITELANRTYTRTDSEKEEL